MGGSQGVGVDPAQVCPDLLVLSFGSSLLYASPCIPECSFLSRKYVEATAGIKSPHLCNCPCFLPVKRRPEYVPRPLQS